MISESVAGALGDGWLGKLIVGSVCGAGAWFIRRPAEKAALMVAVDQRVSTLLTHMEKEVERACKRCDEMAEDLAAERARCDAELALMRAEIDRLMRGPVAAYPTISIQPKGKRP